MKTLNVVLYYTALFTFITLINITDEITEKMNAMKFKKLKKTDFK